MLFEEVTYVPTIQLSRMFPVGRQTLDSAHPAPSRLKYKASSHARTFGRLIPRSRRN